MDLIETDSGCLPIIGVGQAGCEIAAALWVRLCEDHRIDPETGLSDEGASGCWEKLFTMVGAGSTEERYVPRSVFIDPDPRGCNELMRKWRELFNPATFVTADESSANNFAIGFHERSVQMSSQIRSTLLRLIEKGPPPSGFIVLHSYGGGSGSGLTAHLLSLLAEIAPGIPIFSIGILPSKSVSTAVTEPYNAVFGIAAVMKHASLALLFENDQLRDQIRKFEETQQAEIPDCNKLIAEMTAAATGPVRYNAEGEPAGSLGMLSSDLAPHPDFPFAMGTAIPVEKLLQKHPGIETSREMFEKILSEREFWCPQLRGTVMGLGLFGSAGSGNTVQTGYGQAADPVESEPPIPRYAQMYLSRIPSPRSYATILVNSTAACDLLDQLCEQYDQLWERKAFINWYLDAGMSEAEMEGLRREVEFRRSRYQDL